MPPLDVLITHQLPLYREVLTAALAASRPDLHIQAVSPDDFDIALLELRPRLVISSMPMLTPSDASPACINLYQDPANHVVVRAGTHVQAFPNTSMKDLLAIIQSLLSPSVPTKY